MSVKIEIGNAVVVVDAAGLYQLHIEDTLRSKPSPALVFPQGFVPTKVFESNRLALSSVYWAVFCLETGLHHDFYADLGLVNLRGAGAHRMLIGADCQSVRASRIAYEQKAITGNPDACTWDQRSIFTNLLWFENEIFHAFNTYPHPGIRIIDK